MSERYLSNIFIFAGNFAPRGFAFCNGQIMSIPQNTALFSLLGTTYGGNGQQTYALPNLQSRTPVGFGPSWNAPHPSNEMVLGETGGVESVALTIQQIGAHTHQMPATTSVGAGRSPAGGLPARADRNVSIYAPANNLATLATTTQVAGNGLPHSNIQPCLAINFVIAIEGLFPSRN
ncbi:MAG: phage tail protein [Brevundimonas sp.]|uniref:phage tail protein n=1 Tax=Brevundimonas sp. TaxID=1871086 RepID=UPI00403317B0